MVIRFFREENRKKKNIILRRFGRALRVKTSNLNEISVKKNTFSKIFGFAMYTRQSRCCRYHVHLLCYENRQNNGKKKRALSSGTVYNRCIFFPFEFRWNNVLDIFFFSSVFYFRNFFKILLLSVPRAELVGASTQLRDRDGFGDRMPDFRGERTSRKR